MLPLRNPANKRFFMDHGTPRLVLIFPPLTMPTSPPLGLAMLRGHIRAELPHWDVRLLDLNLWLFHRLVSGIVSGQIRPSADVFQRLGVDAGTLGRAANVFTGKDPDTFFRRPDEYDLYGDVFLRFPDVWSEILHDECAAWEKNGIVGPLLDELCAEIDALAPDVVGFSVNFTPQLPIAAMLGRFQRLIRRRTVVFGGGCFSGDGSDYFLCHYPEAADAVVTGDGEGPLAALLRGQDRAFVPGVRHLCGGRIVGTPPVCLDADTHAMPDFGGLHLNAYFSPEPVVPLLSARGCYWRRCAFCAHHLSAGNRYRPYPIARIVETMRGFVRDGVNDFSFVDEMIPPGRFLELARAIEAANLDVAYYALARPERGFSAKLFKKMAASGCRYLLWGIESASQRVLDLMNKGTRVETISRVLFEAREAGIANHVFVMCGFPSETAQEWGETVRFLHNHREAIQAVHRGVFNLQAGSPVTIDPAGFGLTKVEVLRQTPLGPRLGYACSTGMSMAEALTEFKAVLPFLRGFNPHARCAANFRDHALLLYDRAFKNLR